MQVISRREKFSTRNPSDWMKCQALGKSSTRITEGRLAPQLWFHIDNFTLVSIFGHSELPLVIKPSKIIRIWWNSGEWNPVTSIWFNVAVLNWRIFIKTQKTVKTEKPHITHFEHAKLILLIKISKIIRIWWNSGEWNPFNFIWFNVAVLNWRNFIKT